MFGMMDMLPPVTPAQHGYVTDDIAAATLKAAQDDMLAASTYLHALHGAEATEMIDVSVTCDGTWSKRGNIWSCGGY